MILFLVLLVLSQEKLIIQSPDELTTYFLQKYSSNGIPYSLANYGDVPYGKVITGAVNTPTFLKDCVYEEIPDAKNSPIILMERSGCTFTQKSLNAQKQGAKLAIIIDNKIQQPGQIIIIEDGRGSQVHIPTILIGKEDGEILLDYLQKGKIVLSVSFETVLQQKADVNVWLDITQHRNFIFLRKFQPYYEKIKDSVRLAVEYPTKKCDYCSQQQCYYDKRYCSLSNNNHLGGLANAGNLLIRQQIRQKVLSQQSMSQWWSYVLAFDMKCATYIEPQICSRTLLGAQVFNTIEAKVDSSFGEEDNQILKRAAELRVNNSILYFPTIFVNGLIYRGNLEPFEVFQLICESFNSPPEGCTEVQPSNEINLKAWIIFVVVAVVFFTIFLIFCYRRIARRQISEKINKHVNELVNQYISMYESEKFQQGGKSRQKKEGVQVQMK